MRYLNFAAAVLLPAAAYAQPLPSAPAASEPAVAPAPAPAVAPLPAAPTRIVLPADAEIAVILVTDMHSGKVKVGDKFRIVTAEDALQDGNVVIPQGTEGEGRVTFAKGGGSFGKSGALEIAFTSLTLNGHQVPLQGKYREQGAGNGGAATGAVVAVGLVGGFLVHGHSVTVPAGKVMHARTSEAISIDTAPAAG